MLNIYLETSCGAGLRSIFFDGTSRYFRIAEDAALADIVIFQREDWQYVRGSELFQKFSTKCICISEWDKPSFFIPGIYSSNERNWYSRDRAETMNYPILARDRWNEWVTRLATEPCPRKYLYSFIGKRSSRVRKHLLQCRTAAGPFTSRGDILVEGSVPTDQQKVTYGDASKRHYAEILRSSKFALCPRGWGTSSVRLFEACEMGIAPVILSDYWVPIEGIDWSFALFVRERDVCDIERVIRAHETEWEQRGARARQIFLKHFANEQAARVLAAAIMRLVRRKDLHREASLRRWYPLIHTARRINERMMKWFPAYRP